MQIAAAPAPSPLPLAADANHAAPAVDIQPKVAPLHQIAQCLVPGDVVFDVGANNGDKAAALLSRGVKLICVEPQPACVALLNARFAGNPNVAVVPKGLAGRPGIMEMSINSKSPVLSTFSPEWKTGRFANETWDHKLDIAVTTLDQLVLEHGTPRYAKIDVEGFEYEVICGLSKRIGVVSFEFTSEFFANSERLMRYLENLGYRKFNFSLGERTDFAIDQWVGVAQLSAILKNIFSQYNKVWGDIYAN